MTTLKWCLLTFAVSILVSCEDKQEVKPDKQKTLIIGDWDSYEAGNATTGFIPGIRNDVTLMYESGLVFAADGRFGPRYHNAGVWTESLTGGTYEFVDDKNIVLTFSPKTKDELKLPLQVVKLDKDHLWFQHRFWVNDQNPFPTEQHLKRAK